MLNEYDEILQSGGTVGNEYDAIVKQQANDQQTRVRGAMQVAGATSPDRAAKVIELSKRTNLPAPIVERNFDALSKKNALGDNDYEKLIRENPKLTAWLSDPENAAVAADDVGLLARIENTFRMFGSGYSKADIQPAQVDLLWREMDQGTLAPQDAARLKALKDRAQKLAREESPGVPEYVAGATGYSVRQLASSLYAGAEGVGYGGVAGALVGSVLPGVGTVAGGTAGMIAGGLTATAHYSYRMESAFAFDELRSMKDVNGNPIDPALARNTAKYVGAVNAMIESGSDVLIATLIPGFGKLVGGLGKDAAKRAVMREVQAALATPTRRAMIARAVGKMAAIGSVEGIEEFVQSLVGAGGREVAQGVSGQTFAPDSVVDDLDKAAAEALQAAVGTFFTFAPVGGASYYIDARKAAKAEQQQAFFTALGEGVSESKTFGRLPEKMQEFIEQATKDGPIETVFMPIEAWSTYWQSKGIDPAAVADQVLGDSGAYLEALQTGNDLAIPMAVYATKLAPTEHNQAFVPELRLAPDEMNAREAEAFKAAIAAEQAKALEAAAAAPADQAAQGVEQVQADIKAKLVTAGVEASTAEAYAATYGAAFRSIAERAGVDPAALYGRYGLQISRAGMPQQEGETKIADQTTLEQRAQARGLPLAEVGQFKTGAPVTFKYMRRTTKAPRPGPDDQFAQKVEPAGRYMLAQTPGDNVTPDLETGEVAFQNPLVIEQGEGLYTDPTNWKQRLSAAYQGKTGSRLSKAIAAEGYDGIVTVGRHKSGETYPSEIVDLTPFKTERELVITHNMTAANLLHAAKMGGIPVPSMAITKAADSMTNFGEITMIGPREMADPRGYARTRVFASDLYAPRYPKVTYKLKSSKINEVKGLLAEAIEATGSPIDWDEVQNRGPAQFENEPAVMWAFLKRQGIEPDIVMESRPTEEQIAALREAGFEPWFPVAGEYYDTQRLARDEAFQRVAYEWRAQGLRAAGAEDLITPFEEMSERDRIVSSFHVAGNELSKIGEPTRVDRFRTRDAMRSQIRGTLDMAFHKYANEVFARLDADEKLFKGHTYSGRPIYRPHTLENVVRMLKKEIRGGESLSNLYGVGQLRAKFTPQFRSVTQIREAAGRIVSKQNFEAIKEEVNAEFFAVSDALAPYYDGDAERLGFSDTVMALIDDAHRIGFERAAKDYGFKNVPPDVREKLYEFVTRLRNMPTEYFEAKILREVDIAEFAAAVVPDNAPQDVLDLLGSRGVTVAAYKAGDEAARKAKVAEVSDRMGETVLFQGNTIDGVTGEVVPGPLFYSELENQVERAKMDRAPVAQWKQFIEGRQKAGVLKKEEVLMSGVMDWLDIQDKEKARAKAQADQKALPQKRQVVMVGDKTLSEYLGDAPDIVKVKLSSALKNAMATTRDGVTPNWRDAQLELIEAFKNAQPDMRTEMDVAFELVKSDGRVRIDTQEIEPGSWQLRDENNDVIAQGDALARQNWEKQTLQPGVSIVKVDPSKIDSRISKQDILDYLAEHHVKVETKVLGEPKSKKPGTAVETVEPSDGLPEGYRVITRAEAMELGFVNRNSHPFFVLDSDGDIVDAAQSREVAIQAAIEHAADAENAIDEATVEERAREMWESQLQEAAESYARESDYLNYELKLVLPNFRIVELPADMLRDAAGGPKYGIQKLSWGYAHTDEIDSRRYEGPTDLEELAESSPNGPRVEWLNTREFDSEDDARASIHDIDGETAYDGDPYFTAWFYDASDHIGEYESKAEANDAAEEERDRIFNGEVEMYLDSADFDDEREHFMREARDELEYSQSRGRPRERTEPGVIPVRHKGKWQSDGGRDYRELPIGVMGAEPWGANDDLHFGDVFGGRTVAWVRFKIHDDKNGVPTLWVEELQSKRGEEGLSHGFKKSATPEQNAELDRLRGDLNTRRGHYGAANIDDIGQHAFARLGELVAEAEDRYNDAVRRFRGGTVPSAPFVENTQSWTALALKTVLRYAADAGLKQIAWTTGAENAVRYGIKSHVDSIEFEKSEGGVTIKAIKDGKAVLDRKIENIELASVLGARVAQSIIGREEQRGSLPADEVDSVNGLGMLAYYGDRSGLNAKGEPAIVTIVANKIVKALGGAGVKTIDIAVTEKRETFDGAPGFEITEQMKSKIISGLPLFQRTQDQPRGSISFTQGPNRKFRIDLLEGANLSTFIHESGHFWLEILGDIVQELRVGDQAKLSDKQRKMVADYDTVLKWFGVTSRDQITREHHEKFARAIEHYFMEGKAPSSALRQIFARVRAWMISIYRSLRQLNVAITPEVREVFDRMFATDEEIANAEAEAKIEPLFIDAASAGMSEPEFAAYRARLEKASSTARDELQAKVMKAITREREQWWKSERAKVAEEIARDVNQRRDQIALSVLTRDTMPDGSPVSYGVERLKLSRKQIDAMLGEGAWKSLPRGSTATDGVPLATAGEMLGYSSPDELVKALRTARPAGVVIDEETDARMRAEHGDMLVDGTIADAARVAVQNDERAAVIQAELRALGKLRATSAPAVTAERSQRAQAQAAGISGLRGTVPPLATVRAMAAGRISQIRVRDLKPSQYLVAARRASQAAKVAAAAQDFQAAISDKQRELLNIELYRASMDALDEVDATVDFMQGFAKGSARARLAKAGQDYLDQIDGFLDRYDFARVSLKALDRRKALATWVAEKEKAGEPVNLPDDVILERRTNYKDLAIEELRGVRDSVKHIAHLAKLKNKLLTAKRKRDLQAVVDEVEGSIRSNAKKSKGIKVESRLPEEETLRGIESMFGWHRKLSSYVRQLDGFTDGGAMWEYIMRPINAAGDAEAVMNRKATKKLQSIFSAYKGRDITALYEKTTVPALRNADGSLMSLSKMARLMIALNWGNADNRQKIMDGYALNEQQIESILDALDARDWKFVQDTWDFIDSFWPQIEAKEKRVNGLAPAKVQATPVQTKFGELRGGYFPLKYDDRQSPRAYGDRVKEATEQMMRGAYTRATTLRGHTKERVEGVKRQIRLDFGVIFEHVGQVIHDLSHHEMLIDVNRVLGSKAVSGAVTEVYGDIVYKQLQSAIEDIAAGNVPATGAFEKSLNWIRTGMTVAGLGWNVFTSLLQPFGLAQSIVRVGPQWIGKGLARWMGDSARLENTAAWIKARSPMMATRMDTQLREINEIRQEIGLNTGRISGWIDAVLRTTTLDTVNKQAVVDSYFWLIYKGQQIADIPTWIGAYEKALADTANLNADGTHDEARAVMLADQAVLDSQGGGQAKDLARIQRGTPLLKVWTAFYSYFNVTYNLSAESIGRTKFTSAASLGRLAVDMLLLYTLPATLAALMRSALRGDDDDEDELLTKLIRENLAYMFGVMVGLREIGSVLQGYQGYSGPAGARFFSEIGRLIKQTEQAELDAAFWKALNQSAGILLHYPAGQVQRTVEGFVALQEGQTRNPLALLVGPPRD